MLHRALCLPLFALSVSPVRAQDSAPITVTGWRLEDGAAARVFDARALPREALLAAPSGRIEEVLAGVAGFQQFRRSDSRSANPSAQGVTLRALGGNATSRALVLLDGVPLADPFFGYIPLSSLDPARLSAVRITRGGGAGPFGVGAVAGTIELVGAGPDLLGPVAASALINDRGESELSASLAPRLGGGYAVLSARWDRGQGFWTTPAAQRVPASVRARFDGWSAELRAAAPLSPDWEMQMRMASFRDARTLRFAGANTTSEGSEVSLRLLGKGAWRIDALAYLQIRDFTNRVISSTTFRPTLDQYATPSTGAGGKVELRPPLGGGHDLRLGFDWKLARGLAREVAMNATTGAVTVRREAGGHQSDLGLYVQDDWTLGNLVIAMGGRLDRWRETDGFLSEVNGAGVPIATARYADRLGWQATWRFGGSYRITPQLALRAAAYTGFRLPTLNELYRPFAVFPITTRANAALAPERLRGVEAGIDWSSGDIAAVYLNAFANRLDDAVANVTIGTNLRERRNVDGIAALGIEAGARLRWRALRFEGSLALTDATVRASGLSAALNGKRPAQTPRLAASAALGWQPSPGWNAVLTLRHTGSQFEDDLEIDRLGPATTLGAFVEIPLAPRLRLVLRGENLTDAAVITRNQGGSLDYGAPRTLWIGFRLGGI